MNTYNKKQGIITATILASSMFLACDTTNTDSEETSSSVISSSVEVSSVTSSLEQSSSSAQSSSSILTSKVFIHTSDFKSGALRWMNKDGISTESIIFNQDSKIISSGKYLYILERSTDANISRIDATQLSNGNDAVQYQQSLGSKANPEDVAIVNSTLGWIALSGRDHLLAFNPETGVLTDSVSLAGFKQEGENSPNPTSLVLKGDTLCVIMQRLKLWTPDMPGLVALLHAKTGAIIDTIQLKGSNPNGAVLVGSKLYVANSGDLMNTELNEKKSLDVVDFAQGSASVFVSGATLGGGPSGIAVDIDSGILYVGVYKDFGDEPIASIQIANKTVTTFSDVIDSFGGIAFDPEAKLLYVGDRAFGKEAVKVWNGTTFQTVVNNGALPAMGIAVVTY